VYGIIKIMSEYGAESGCGTFLVGLALTLAIDAGVGEYVQHHYSVNDGRTFLEQSGYKDPKVKDVDTFGVGFAGCDYTDATKYEFTAVPPNGDGRIRVMVCNGLFKGATIRQGGV
jgi:hypothetical protein